MKRKYYLADTLDALDQTVAVLHNELNIKDNNIHVISNNMRGLKEHHLHPANFILKSDIIRGAEQGIVYGLTLGMMFFVVAACQAPFWDITLPVRQMILLTILTSPIILGFLSGAFVGVLNHNFRISPFDHELDIGHHLLLVDTENSQDISKSLADCPITDVGETNTVIFPFDESTSSFQQVA